MQATDFVTLYGYNFWANGRILEAAARLTPEQFTTPVFRSGYRSVRGTLVHMVDVDWLYLERWRGTSPTTYITEADLPDLLVITVRWQREGQGIRDFVAGLGDDDLEQMITYTNRRRGASLSFPLWQLLLHVVNHGTQHRSELAVMLSEFGQSPGELDLVHYLAV